MRALGSFSVWCALALGACDAPRATVGVTDARASRDAAGRVVVVVELQASEGLGGNVGSYCVRVSFAGEADREDCRADLEDGDTVTLRFVSSGALPAGAAIGVRVRLGAVDVRRTLAAPR